MSYGTFGAKRFTNTRRMRDANVCKAMKLLRGAYSRIADHPSHDDEADFAADQIISRAMQSLKETASV